MNSYKRHIHNYLLPLLLLLMGTACNKQLDLKPENTMVESELLKNEGTTESFLGDTYLQLMAACGGNAFTLPDFSAATAKGYDNAIVSGDVDPRDKNYYGLWDQPYKTINQANVIITQLGKYATFDKTRQQGFIAEAKFIRAMAYLQLLEMYGDGALQNKPENMGVPLRLESFEGYDGSQIIPRATNGAVYTQIIKDLDEAIAVLPADRKDALDQGSRATRGAANALAARVSLYEGKYDKAATYAAAAMEGNRYQLASSFEELWPNHAEGGGRYPINKEVLFAFPESFNNTNRYNDSHGIYYIYYTPEAGFMSTYQATDERATELMVLGPLGIDAMRKFTDPNTRDNVTMIRLAEVMLTRAEALARKDGVNAISVGLLNEVYARAFTKSPVPKVYTAADFPNAQALIDRILQERKWELAFEGFARYDAIRTGKRPNPLMPPEKFYLPVPQREIDVTNGLIKQSPGF
ncbi:RagB/SusD family nutrient uptake outer membrane protein [Chitinophaga defluvii]|uniref:RagB/SusD family nutrient uptake outer membrane protein n=1 Tax=Chitinophaga defluvii TaxID=3163343 RepID=A0ABV2TA60_9BACT